MTSTPCIAFASSQSSMVSSLPPVTSTALARTHRSDSLWACSSSSSRSIPSTCCLLPSTQRSLRTSLNSFQFISLRSLSDSASEFARWKAEERVVLSSSTSSDFIMARNSEKSRVTLLFPIPLSRFPLVNLVSQKCRKSWYSGPSRSGTSSRGFTITCDRLILHLLLFSSTTPARPHWKNKVCSMVIRAEELISPTPNTLVTLALVSWSEQLGPTAMHVGTSTVSFPTCFTRTSCRVSFTALPSLLSITSSAVLPRAILTSAPLLSPSARIVRFFVILIVFDTSYLLHWTTIASSHPVSSTALSRLLKPTSPFTASTTKKLQLASLSDSLAASFCLLFCSSSRNCATLPEYRLPMHL
mmetsp:Transcript_49872/g.156081  ORF Transcript_49872/g.156081 Transcript_49872/m.156081 type:complete len:357 (+) Transcript_49872:1338-2408(+)